jgi:hypothetical protein
MNRPQIVDQIDHRISQLQQAKWLLGGTPITKPARDQRTISKESRLRMSATQLARRARERKG